MVNIRSATLNDLPRLHAIATQMGTTHEQQYFERCLHEQGHQRRLLLVAESNAVLAGYVQMIWNPEYAPFRALAIPEIQDLNIIPQWRRQGLGRLMVEHCEAQARAAGKTEVGIGVGLYARFGAAQRLYVKMGYIPDGAGICYDEIPVKLGELRAIDDFLTLKLIKTLVN
jgi:GNAT superfamily N-acetyltransferase